jgi:hypothetical protein
MLNKIKHLLLCLVVFVQIGVWIAAKIYVATVVAFETNHLRDDKAERWIHELRFVAELAHVYDLEQVLFQLDHLTIDVFVKSEDLADVFDELKGRTSELVAGAERLGKVLVC